MQHAYLSSCLHTLHSPHVLQPYRTEPLHQRFNLHTNSCLRFGGINRFKFLWHDVVLVTDPAALGVIMGRGEGAVDKAFETYAPINKMCDPHGQPNLLTAQGEGTCNAILAPMCGLITAPPVCGTPICSPICICICNLQQPISTCAAPRFCTYVCSILCSVLIVILGAGTNPAPPKLSEEAK
jgi:hypothetical protein